MDEEKNILGNNLQTPLPQIAENLTPNPPKKDGPLKIVLGAFLNSKSFKPVLIAITLVVFLIGLTFFVIKNLGTAGTGGDIIWWGISHDESVYAPLIAEFEKLNPNIKVKYQRQSTQDYRERLQTALAQGKDPDIFEMHNSWPPMLRNSLAKLPSSVWSEEDYKNSFYPVVYTNFNLNGGIVAVPLEYDALTLFINEDIFAGGAKKPPISWDELRDLSGVLTQKDGRGVIIQSGSALGLTKNIDYWPDILGLMMAQNRVNPLKPTGAFAQDVLSFYTMFNKRFWDDTLPPSTEAFAKGKLAMYFGPTREAINIVRENNQLRFRTVNLPQLAKNTPQDPDFSYATYWAHGVSAKSKKANTAWQFLKFMASPESLKKINTNIKKSETFPRVYPRPSMNEEMREDAFLGSVISLAGSAASSPLSDKTFDGSLGINSKVNKLYEGVINLWKGKGNQKIMDDLNKNLVLVLSEFGISIK